MILLYEPTCLGTGVLILLLALGVPLAYALPLGCVAAGAYVFAER